MTGNANLLTSAACPRQRFAPLIHERKEVDMPANADLVASAKSGMVSPRLALAAVLVDDRQPSALSRESPDEVWLDGCSAR